jgi:intracellular sulfur oxidation DsrE/DsrF family protein
MRLCRRCDAGFVDFAGCFLVCFSVVYYFLGSGIMRGLSRFAVILAFLTVVPVSVSLAAEKKNASPAAQEKVSHASEKRAEKAVHRLVIQVDQNDPALMNLALNNATNVLEYYRAKGEDVDLDIVTYGPGLNMLRTDTSPVQDRIKNLKDLAFPSNIQFSACNNTKEGMEKKEGHPVPVMSEAVLVPSGVVRLMELQEKGWSYIRP